MIENIRIKKSSPFAEDVRQLILSLDEYQRELYPDESNHFDSLDVLAEPNCQFLGAYQGEQLVGIGAAKIIDDYGELKRFFLPKKFRGRGIAEAIIQTLESWLISQRIYICRLETGIHQHGAIRFYEKLGYSSRGPFGTYRQDPLSVFMEKTLVI